MNTEKNEVALLVHSCDRYEFLYQGFEHFFSKHWDFSIPCNLYFATENLNVNIQNFQTIQSGNGPWANRLKFLLTNKIKEKYILYFQEDMWFTQPINAQFFSQLFELTKNNNWQQVKLHSADIYQTISTNHFIEGFNISKLNNAQSDYLMSHQITLWDKNFLIPQLSDNEHPWRNERKGTKRLKTLNPEIFHADYFAENGNEAINNNKNPVLRSAYWAISVNGILNDRIKPFIAELKKGKPDEMAYALKLEHNYTHQLTHDGKAKPRKVDLFKRIKNWLKGKK